MALTAKRFISCILTVRKLISILLICCIFIYESGYLLFFIFQQVAMKEEMRAYIKDHPGEQGAVFSFVLEKGKVTDAAFEWEEEGYEFSYHGQMFDVLNAEEANGKLLLHAINDKQEEQLITAMAGHHSQKQHSSLFQLISLLFTLNKTELQLPSIKITRAVFFNRDTPKEKLMAFEIQSPPPDVV
jgi:hypothetical protein